MANHVYFNIEMSLDAGQTDLVEKLGNSCKEKLARFLPKIV